MISGSNGSNEMEKSVGKVTGKNVGEQNFGIAIYLLWNTSPYQAAIIVLVEDNHSFIDSVSPIIISSWAKKLWKSTENT